MSLKRLGLITLKPNYVLFTQQTKYHPKIIKKKTTRYKELACFLISESSGSIVCTLLTTPALSVTFLPELLSRTSMRPLPFHSTSQPPPSLWVRRSLLAGLLLLLEHSMSSICIISHHCTAERQYAPRLHTVAPTNHISSVEHCLLAAILPVITLLHPESSQNPLQPGPLTIIFSGSLPSDRKRAVQEHMSSSFQVGLNVVMNLEMDSGYILPRAAEPSHTSEDSFFQRIRQHVI